VANAIAARITLSKEQTVLDFGCGTGLVTLKLAPNVGSITGADTSPGMLKALAEKAETQGIQVRLIPLDTPGTGDGPYHLIVSSMTLHHIADVPALFRQFMQDLYPGGEVTLADLDQEDGSFHEDSTGVYHFGFKRSDIRAWLEEAGFREIHLEIATVAHKNGKDYPVFLATARKA
jgi:cyclopropane fatty-acyl-phospholipid synthase-like methyltransferase